MEIIFILEIVEKLGEFIENWVVEIEFVCGWGSNGGGVESEVGSSGGVVDGEFVFVERGGSG